MAEGTRRFSTGLSFLDGRIGGGLAVGSLLALEAPPGSQSELLLAQLLSTRPTLYVTVTRPAAEVREWAEQAGTPGDLSVVDTTPEEFLASPSEITRRLPPESLLIVDPVNDLETGTRDEYLDALDRLKRLLQETDSVGVLHCLDRDPAPPYRWLTMNRADAVWQLEVQALSRDINTRLLVTKARFGQPLTEPIPLVLTDAVRIDTSRRIS